MYYSRVLLIGCSFSCVGQGQLTCVCLTERETEKRKKSKKKETNKHQLPHAHANIRAGTDKTRVSVEQFFSVAKIVRIHFCWKGQ